MPTTRDYAIRECAQSLIRLFEAPSRDEAVLRDGILAATRQLIERADLTDLGVKRQGNFVNNSKFIYYDGQLEITLNQMPKGVRFPPHDHGTCESLIMYSGRLAHTVYKRVDDETRPEHAELAVIEDSVLERGDITVMVPPIEIHSFMGLTDDCFLLTVVDGRLKADRHFYDPETHSYSVGTPKKWRDRTQQPATA
jgi:predicted metal-dependent enzyme (double-stranded beta helix superfamily)